MTTQHTLGPWAIRPPEAEHRAVLGLWVAGKPGPGPIRWIDAADGFPVAELRSDNPADAALIAAAPELLAALRDLVDAQPYVSPTEPAYVDRHGAALAAAFAALAKATG